MCDYSLEHFNNRKARAGETLMVHRFPTESRGFINANDPDCAVCVIPGTLLMLSKIPGGFREVHHVDSIEEAIFEQKPGRNPEYDYRDGILLKSTGVFVLLRELPTDIGAIVLQIPSTNADIKVEELPEPTELSFNPTTFEASVERQLVDA